MNNKLISIMVIIALVVGIFAVSVTVVNANMSGFLPSRNRIMTVVLKDNTDMTKAKDEISRMSKVKIVSVQDRNIEWSRMVNKMDLPKMDNPFKNEIVIKINKNGDMSGICNKIKEMDFVESVEKEPER